MRSVGKDYFIGRDDGKLYSIQVITYELLDEMMDNGFPQTTEVKILREYIKTKSHQMQAVILLSDRF